MQSPLDISHEISLAINRNEPVVALESSLIAHGLPSEVNIETALAMEQIIRGEGVLPATIGIIEGKVRVGMTKAEIEKLGKGNASKITFRDIPYAAAKKLDGGTTVSATARIASAAGITIMATGGIGGVHRNAADTFDISADLWELAHTAIVVVCSGAKAVLDIQATAEWLETHSVPVYGYETDELPSFYSRSSGISISKVDDISDFAGIIKLSRGVMGIRSAAVLAVPIPKSAEIDVSKYIDQALKKAAEDGIRGKDLTPYLLSKIGEFTKGKSIDANIALLKNNASVAAKVAIGICEETRRRMGFTV